MSKVGHTIATFSVNRQNPNQWMLTKSVDDVLANWEKVSPSGTPPSRRVPVVWNEEARNLIVEMAQNIRNTRQMIAERLNNPDVGDTYRHPDARPFRAEDVTRELQRLFPRELDLMQMCWCLQDLKTQKGWEDLDYYVLKTQQTILGRTIKCLTIVMPNSKQLLAQYGKIIHCDCTFGCLLAGHKTMGTGVIDGEGHSRLASISIAPGHTKEDWLEMFNITQRS